MKRRTLATAVALLAAGALTLTACARNEQPTGGNDGPGGGDQTEMFAPGIYEQDAPAEPTAGGTLTIADFAETRSLDPTKTIATGYSGGSSLVAVYDQLVRWNVRDQAFEPRLAESIEPNDDHTQWTITLREGVEFSDGTPLNADAVIGSFNYYVENRGYDLGVVGPLWAGAEKVDDRTVQVNLRGSWATFPFALGMGMGFIVAPAAIENSPDAFEPIGAGAFTFESYKPSEEMILTKNPNYWDGEPYLDSLRLVWLGADETKLESMNAGSVQAAVFRDIQVIQDARQNEISGWMMSQNLGNIIMVNKADDRPGADPRISEAIAYAIDEQALYDRIFDGLGAPTKHLFAPDSLWYTEEVETREFDPAKAQELVDAAKADGFDGNVGMVSAADPISRDQALALQAQLEAVGFTVENEFPRTIADSTSKVFVERDYDLARTSISMGDEDPYWRLFSAYHSQSAANAVGFADPEFDALIEELRATDGDARQDVLTRIDQAFSDKLPAVTFAGNISFNPWAQNVHGIQPTNDAMMAFEKAWIAN